MSESPNPDLRQATPFKRFTIRLIDGHFVRVPAIGAVSVNGRHRPDLVRLLAPATEESETKPATHSFSAIPSAVSARLKKT